MQADTSGGVGLPTTPIPVVAGGPVIGLVTESEWREETRVPYVDRGEAKIWYTDTPSG